jgi:hypothetical protein
MFQNDYPSGIVTTHFFLSCIWPLRKFATAIDSSGILANGHTRFILCHSGVQCTSQPQLGHSTKCDL